MKNIKLYIFMFATIFSIISCEEKYTDVLIEPSDVGGLIVPSKNLIGYTIGNGDTFEYKNTLNVNQSGVLQVTKILVYKKFLDTRGTADDADDRESNEILLRTIDVPTDAQNVFVPLNVTYPQLIQGLTVNGAPLPANDTNLFIGDSFTLRYEQIRSDGKRVESSRSSKAITKIAVGTRLAGLYKTIDAVYYRIGVLTATATSWPAKTIIESVDATNYKIVGNFGFFGPVAGGDPNDIRFIVNGTAVSYSPLQLTGNGQPFITCGSSPSNFNPEVNCGTSNKVVLDLVTGKDKIYMTFGYLSPSGPRVFYQVLEKIVD